jgi:putative endonuclease
MNPPSRARKNLGASGERLAADYLAQRGYEILARNVRTRAGEIDLVALDADTLVFVEVRTRRGEKFGTPEESITGRKQLKLIALAEEFLQTHAEFAGRAYRIDVVGIQLDRAGRVTRVNVIQNAVGD